MPDLRMKVELNPEDRAVTYSVLDRENDDALVTSRTFSGKNVHADLVDRIWVYGLRAFLSDRTSDTKVSEGVEEKLNAMSDVLEMLEAGEWEKEREVGARIVSAEVEALAELNSCSISDIQASLKRYPEEARKKMFSHPDVVAKANEIRARRESTAPLDLGAFVSAA